MPGNVGANGRGIGSAASPLKDVNKELTTAVTLTEKLVKQSTKYYDIYSAAARSAIVSGGGTTSALNMKGMGTSGTTMGVMAGVMVGATAYSALPDVARAVSQRMTTQQVASFSGRGYTPASVLSAANAANRGGFTSAEGMSNAAAAFQGMGYSMGSQTVRGNLRQIGGMSVISGLANEQVAAGIGSINSMNFLRMGIVARNPNGSLKSIGEIASTLYSRMYAGRNPTPEQANAVFRTNSAAYQNIYRAAGGDPNMIRMLQTYIVKQAQQGGRPLDLKDTGKMMNAMGWDANSPERAQFKASSAEARQLQATGSAQVEGYSGALNAAAKLTDGFTNLYKAMEPVTSMFARMQGFAGTFGNVNNVSGSIAGLGSGLTSLGMNAAGNYMAFKGIQSAMSAGSSAAGTAAGGVMSKGTKFLGGFFKSSAVKVMGKIAAPIAVADAAMTGYKDSGWDWGHALGSAGAGAAIGATMGAGVFSAPGAIIGGLAGLATYGIGHALGSGGGGPDMSNGAAGPSKITTPYGKKGKQWHWKGYHTGVDFAANMGDPIYAKMGGTVSDENPGKSYGINVLIKHDDGTEGLYAHMSKKVVRAGQRVAQGQLIGNVGSTGNSSGPHLHFELRKGRNNPVNPTSWLGKLLGGAKKIIGNVFNATKNAVGSAWNAVTGNSSEGTTGTGIGAGPMNPNGISVGLAGIGSSIGTNIMDLFGKSVDNYWGTFGKSTYANGAVNDAASPIKGAVGKVSNKNLFKLLQGAGFKGDALRTAYAVAIAESNGRANAHNPDRSTGDDSYGIFQINMLGKLEGERNRKFRQKIPGYHTKQDLFNPAINAAAAYYMTHHGENWSSWSTYTSGAYKKHMPTQQAVASALASGGGGPDGGSDGAVVVNATFNITAQNSSASEANKLAKRIASDLEKEIRNVRIGRS